MNDVHYLKFLIYKLLLRSKYRIFNRLSNLLIPLSGTISCMAILQGVIYSRSVTVILEYVDLLDLLAVEYLRQSHAISAVTFYCY